MCICDADEFYGRKTANAHAEFLGEHAKNVRVILDWQFLVHAALQKDLVGAELFGIFCLAADLFQGKHIRAAFPRFAGKGTEATVYRTDVRVIDDAVDRIADPFAGELCMANRIRRLGDFRPFRFL